MATLLKIFRYLTFIKVNLKGKKSIAFSLFYQNPERTLTDEEVEASYQAILAAVADEHQAELRG